MDKREKQQLEETEAAITAFRDVANSPDLPEFFREPHRRGLALLIQLRDVQTVLLGITKEIERGWADFHAGRLARTEHERRAARILGEYQRNRAKLMRLVAESAGVGAEIEAATDKLERLAAG